MAHSTTWYLFIPPCTPHEWRLLAEAFESDCVSGGMGAPADMQVRWDRAHGQSGQR